MLTFEVHMFSSPELDIGVTQTMARTTQPATGESPTNVVHETSRLHGDTNAAAAHYRFRSKDCLVSV